MRAPTPRPGILDIEAYVGGKSSLSGKKRAIKLSSNESALGPSAKAVAAYRKAAGQIYRYPDGGSGELRQALGARHGIDPERIVCGAGSDEIFYLLARGYAGPGDEVLYSEHGFNIYPIVALSVGAKPVAAPETDLTADADALLDRVGPKTRILYLANPNNPTGTYLAADQLVGLRRRLREDILLVVDSAYAEYVDRNDYAPGIELVDGGENVVMTRTFSKIYALGGLRLGWAYCPPRIADVLNRLRGPFNVNAAAQAAGLAALDDAAHVDASCEHNAIWRPWLAERLSALGLRVHPSVANFILVGFPEGEGRNAEGANRFLNARGIIARQTGGYGLRQCLRITIGLEDEMRAVADVLGEFMD